jgi:diaminohydroxyphosphoribosylaminopyrimidine deaminase/5-amino-6-(5-phosphoribosylamino)uracil reductase
MQQPEPSPLPPDQNRLKSDDERWMRHALELARQSIGLASPNPHVGCVLVKDERLVGEGFHEYERLDHAEIVALKQAGGDARGATAYVTLEPCSHTGRTGPCADALIQAGIARVVVATADPNPEVYGKGIERIANAGIEVEVDVRAEEARELNNGFARRIQTGLPYVTLKAGVSLDGRIAAPAGKIAPRDPLPTGRPTFLTGEESRAEVQRMRHASDVIITGINTVFTDNPLLTDRTSLPRRRPLLRVVLDSALRLRLDSHLVRTANDDVVVFCTTPIVERQKALEALGVRVEVVDGQPGASRVSLLRALETLGAMGMNSALLEAGSQVNASALSLKLVDKLVLFYAPLLLGTGAVPLINSVEKWDSPILRTSVRQFGRDVCMEATLRDPWASPLK